MAYDCLIRGRATAPVTHIFRTLIMTSISSLSASTGLSILQMGNGTAPSTSAPLAPPSMVNKAALKSVPREQDSEDIFKFLRSSHFTASSDDVFQGLVKGFSDPTLQDEFSAKIQEEIDNTQSQLHFVMDPDNARNNALFDVIMAHRDDFPPGEFSISFTTNSGAWGSTTIPSADDMGDYLAQQQPGYYSSIGARTATPDTAKSDKDSATLDAMEQAVSTLSMNAQAPVDQGVSDARAAYAILTQKLYFDDADDASGSSAQRDGPEKKASIGS